ncbi:MAG TPA: ThiF family adenylyltransferase [Thermoanaerobaculales bacterium]|nr:ThiF family adenylyltransferase [Thermoanaerobaculales bacterium]
MGRSWITLYPGWYVQERQRLARAYPTFQADERALQDGTLALYGELRIRPPGGRKRVPVVLCYPAATPYEKPIVTPLTQPATFTDVGQVGMRPPPRFFDRRHQMADGALCLFQRETRNPGGDIIDGVTSLQRAERWLLGLETGHFPRDAPDSELEQHFCPGGDVLLSRTFYRDDLGEQGRFYMVPDFYREYDSARPELSAFIMTSLTVEGPVIQPIDARTDVALLYPWIQEQFWDPVALACTDYSGERPPCAHGHWWQLTKEPQPFHNGTGVLNLLASAKDDPWPSLAKALGADLTTQERLFLAFRYPDRSAEPAWLVVCLVQHERPDRDHLVVQRDAEKRRRFEDAQAFCLRTHNLRPATLQLRNTGVVPTRLADKTVALIGLGALGSKVAELLGQAGVGAFRLCDLDRIATGNVARHIGGLTSFGRPKVAVVEQRLRAVNPTVRVQPVFGSIVSSLDNAASFMSGADITIVTTADESVETAINQIALLQNQPVLYGRALRRGALGRVFLVRPGRDACKACLASYAAAPSDQQSPGWIPIREELDDILVHECGRPVIPASAVDLAALAALIARIALDQLAGDDENWNHWLWSRDPAPEVHPGLAGPFSTARTTNLPHPACIACQEPEITTVRLTPTAHEQIVRLAEGSPDAETCGILLGHHTSNREAVVLRATPPGPRAQRSATGCSRDVAYVQAELEQAAAELGDQCQYVGEWHSHLESHPEPSVTDIDALVGIAQAPLYLTRCPVMLIAGLDPADATVHTIGAWAFPLSGRMHAIKCTVTP